MALSLTSNSFRHYGPIPKKFTCDGENASPALSWKNIPPNTQSLALIMDDPDAPPGTWVHWIIYNLAPHTQTLEENLPKIEILSDGAHQGLVGGVDEFSQMGYWGPCPPAGKPHRYFFKLYALDQPLETKPKITKPQLLEAMNGHILEQTELVGLYQR